MSAKLYKLPFASAHAASAPAANAFGKATPATASQPWDINDADAQGVRPNRNENAYTHTGAANAQQKTISTSPAQ
eukprot:5478730-Pleurochrysis_carterae.AAC.1